MRHANRWLMICALGLPLSGCAGPTQLTASDGSHRLMGSDPANGLTVVLTTEAWEQNDWDDRLTIVHLLISNMGSEPVLIAPGDFEMVDGRGFRYALRDAGAAFQTVAQGQSPANAATGLYQPGRSHEYRSIRTSDGSLGRLALPWGVLQPGTQMRGFVYFNDIEKTANHAVLAWYSQTPDNRPIADFGFRLHVAKP